MPEADEIAEALDLAAGGRIISNLNRPQTASRHDVAVTRKTIMLFLEALDDDMTVGELQERLDG